MAHTWFLLSLRPIAPLLPLASSPTLTAPLLPPLSPMPLSLSSPSPPTIFIVVLLSLLLLSSPPPLVPPLLLPPVARFAAVELATRAVYASSPFCVSLLFRAMHAPRSTDWHCLLFNAIIPASPCLVFDGPGIALLETRNSVDIKLGGPLFEDREAIR